MVGGRRDMVGVGGWEGGKALVGMYYMRGKKTKRKKKTITVPTKSEKSIQGI